MFMYKTKYHSALKRNEILLHAMTWIDLENFVLNEETRHQSTNII